MKVQNSRIIENLLIHSNIYKLKVKFEGEIKPGQFFMLKTLNNDFLLPRPISINDKDEDTVTFLYRVEGIGTTSISKTKLDDEIQLLGPLGNGFDIDEIKGNVAIIGGGIGMAPLHYLVKQLKNNVDVYLGFKDSVYYTEELKKHSNNIIIVTEDGSTGEKGYVTDYVNYNKYDVVITCGPEIMMNKIVAKCKEDNIKCYVSLERRMACGIGACLGCTVETINGNKKACKDGPVFLSTELIV